MVRERAATSPAVRWSSCVAVALLLCTVAPRPADAAAGRCSVTNARTGETTRGRGSNLQDALDAVDAGDTLRIEGICIGRFDVSVRVRLIGDPTAAWPRPVLDARGKGRVLSITAPTRIHDVIVRGGEKDHGAGIRYRSSGALVLSGSTLVANNRARFSGGGISTAGFFGEVRLVGHAVVRSNLANSGGGISTGSVVVLGDRSVVRDNRARNDGGGILGYIARIDLRDHAAVIRNRAGRHGGGVADFDGGTWVRGSSRIVHNVAERHGGGVYSFMAALHVCSAKVRLSPNTPDDLADVPVGC